MLKIDEQVKILNSEQVAQKIKRMAYEIYENNFEETHILLAGIYENGFELSQMLCEQIENISDIKTTNIKINLDKSSLFQTEITLDIDAAHLNHKVIILVDDVLNTGRTLAYSLKPFLSIEVKKLEVAVLVDRNHSSFPVSAKYVGYRLSTTLQNHIQVVLEGKDSGIFLY